MIVFEPKECMVHEVSGTDEENSGTAGRKPGWWRRLVIDPVLGQLKQGISPEKLGWSVGTGVAIGIFPVWGTRAWICLLAGWLFKLNQPILHGFKSLLYPVHVLLLIPFIQLGQRILGKPPLKISVEYLKGEMAEGAWSFLREFGLVLLQAGLAWLLVAPFSLFGLKWIVTPLLRKTGVRQSEEKETSA